MSSRCIVVDDEPLARQGIEGYIKRTPFLEHVSSFGTAFKALEFLRREEIDLLFLDIQMPDMTGLELIKVLNHPPKVIFVTAYREFALDGFELDAVDYLLKPISYERFLKAAHKALPPVQAERQDESHFFVKCNGLMVKIPFADILYLETAKDYVFIHTLQQRYMALVPLRQLEERLSSDQFMKVHRSYVVQISKVDKIEGSLLHLAEHKVPVSRRLRDEVYKRIIGDRLIERS